MIGMAEDAYSLKRLEEIKDYDTELGLSKNAIYSSSGGVLYKNGKIFTVEYNENESKILIRDIEGIIINALFSFFSFNMSSTSVTVSSSCAIGGFGDLASSN